MDPKTYARDHQWRFDSGVTVAASAAAGPAIPPGTVGADTVDPEEAVVAALAGCHMLFFLALAAKKGLTIDRYEDAPHGVLESKDGATWLTTITLAPQVTSFSSAMLWPTCSERVCVRNSRRGRVRVIRARAEVTMTGGRPAGQVSCAYGARAARAAIRPRVTAIELAEAV